MPKSMIALVYDDEDDVVTPVIFCTLVLNSSVHYLPPKKCRKERYTRMNPLIPPHWPDIMQEDAVDDKN